MERKRIISAIVIAAALALATQPAVAGISISARFGSSSFGRSHGSIGHGRVVHGSSHGRVFHGSIGHPIIGRSSICSPHISSRIHTYSHSYPYHHKSIIYRHPYYSRYSSICTPRHNIVITVPPVVHRPAPVVKVVESNTITVWFTNTNGSKSSVALTSPRSEYYKTMPTDEQLRMVYGF